MAIDLVALKSELTADPLTLGYAPFVSGGNDTALVGLLNAVGAGANFAIFNPSIGLATLIANIAPADFAALTALQLQQLQLLLAVGQLDLTQSNIRAIVTAIFAGSTTATKNAMTALAKRQGSRCEVLFGAGSSVSTRDIAVALRGAN